MTRFRGHRQPGYVSDLKPSDAVLRRLKRAQTRPKRAQPNPYSGRENLGGMKTPDLLIIGGATSSGLSGGLRAGPPFCAPALALQDPI